MEEMVIFGCAGRERSSCDVRFLKMETAPQGDGAYSLHFNYLFSLQYNGNSIVGAKITLCEDS